MEACTCTQTITCAYINYIEACTCTKKPVRIHRPSPAQTSTTWKPVYVYRSLEPELGLAAAVGRECKLSSLHKTRYMHVATWMDATSLACTTMSCMSTWNQNGTLTFHCTFPYWASVTYSCCQLLSACKISSYAADAKHIIGKRPNKSNYVECTQTLVRLPSDPRTFCFLTPCKLQTILTLLPMGLVSVSSKTVSFPALITPRI